MRVSVDRERCESYGVCMAISPDVFDMDDVEMQIVQPEVTPDLVLSVRDAVRNCPRQALSLEELT